MLAPDMPMAGGAWAFIDDIYAILYRWRRKAAG